MVESRDQSQGQKEFVEDLCPRRLERGRTGLAEEDWQDWTGRTGGNWTGSSYIWAPAQADLGYAVSSYHLILL